ncbi:hypothetical protein MTQ01_13160 [Streptomyces sp. XM4193]|uniref:COG1470 family protein n=1 Tax=Streptomyces sp. XM4193 TaxID=2929782 RepID=UPI001FFA16AB|nr:hypothetical protein [Streptomyces sp. XM4193]MCK1796946.1 hypothetical protein [Streptomyces sp. XM4193]
MPRRLLLIALAAVLCWTTGTAGSTALAVAPAAGPGDDWTARPLSSGRAEGDRPLVYLEGAPGSVLNDTLVLTNSAQQARTYRLSGAEAQGFGESEAKKWVGFAEDRIRVPARTRAEIPFSVTVPGNAPPGDHPGAVRVAGPGGAVDVPLRLRVTGRTLPALALQDVRIDGERVRYTLVNRGNTVLSPKLALKADGWRGTVVERGPKALKVGLAPGERVTRSEPWPGTPAFERVSLTLTVTAGGGAQATAETGESTVPWLPIGLGTLVLVGAAGGAWWVRRGRRADGSGEQPAAEPQFEGDAATEELVSNRARKGANT